MNSSMPSNILKVVVLSAPPVLVILGLGFVAWPSIYLTARDFFPFAPYATNLQNHSPTIFHTDNLGLWFFGGHSLLIALLVAWLSQNKSWSFSWLVHGALVVSGAVPVHAGLHVLGFQYFIETP
jgi:hypothetical protein